MNPLSRALSKIKTAEPIVQASNGRLHILDLIDDEELLALIENYKIGERRIVAEEINAAPSVWIRAPRDSRYLHAPDCPKIRKWMDRDLAWKPYLGNLTKLRHAGKDLPQLPHFVTMYDVAVPSQYKKCVTCKTPGLPVPGDDGARKLPEGSMPVVVRDLQWAHIGRSFISSSGRQLGELQKITISGDEFVTFIDVEFLNDENETIRPNLYEYDTVSMLPLN